MLQCVCRRRQLHALRALHNSSLLLLSAFVMVTVSLSSDLCLRCKHEAPHTCYSPSVSGGLFSAVLADLLIPARLHTGYSLLILETDFVILLSHFFVLLPLVFKSAKERNSFSPGNTLSSKADQALNSPSLCVAGLGGRLDSGWRASSCVFSRIWGRGTSASQLLVWFSVAVHREALSLEPGSMGMSAVA